MSIDALWLQTLQCVCGRAAHEMKGALNGVAVNVEVVRSRAERGDAVATDVQRYATSAADQLGALIALTEAVLGLARVGREPADVGQVTRQLVAVLGPAARSAGHAVELDDDANGSHTTTAPLGAVRLMLAAALLDATECAGLVRCRIQSVPDLAVHIVPAPPDSEWLRRAIDATTAAGIMTTADGHGISITFPSVASHDGTSLKGV